MRKVKRILLVGPINNSGVGGRFEEMKVWANSLESTKSDIWVYSMFNSQFKVGNGKMVESVEIEFKFLRKFPSILKSVFIRIWASKIFKSRRDKFYLTNSWKSFASSFDWIILFINDTSKERLIFESDLKTSIGIRFTGILSDFKKIEVDSTRLIDFSRIYIFHDKALLKGYKPGLTTCFIDQTVIKEESLLNLEITPEVRIFGMVGLFMTVKQISQVITVFKNFPEFELFLYGKGELKSEYESLISQLNISNIKFKGFFPAEKIEKVYSGFDCLIINSLNETGPMTGVEAMAAGRLIISKPVGAMETRLSNPELLFDNEAELSDLLLKIGSWSPEKINSDKIILRKRYLENYSNESIRNQILSCLDIK